MKTSWFLNLFKHALWTLMYLHNRKKKKKQYFSLIDGVLNYHMTKKKKDVDGGKVQNKRFPDILLLLYSVGFDNFIKKKAKKAQI